MGYFEDAIKREFPPHQPFRPYVWPKLVHEVHITKLERSEGHYGGGSRIPWPIHGVELTKLERSEGQHGGGSRVPMAVRRISHTKLVTSYRFVKSVWHRLAIIKRMPPPQSLLHHMSLHAPGIPAKGASKGRRTFDPYGDFAFHVEIEGIGAGSFAKFDGIELEVDQIEYKDSLDAHPHKRPGIYHFGNLKLTKGVIANKALWDWCHQTMGGDVQRKNGSVHVLSDPHDKSSPEITYHFYQAWPCKWSGLKLDGKGNATLVEELELVVDSVARAK